MNEKFSEIINGDTPVLIDFYAEWCGPCKTMSPMIEELGQAYKGKLRVLKVDVDKNPKASQFYGIQGIPTFIIYKDGEIQWRQSGAMPREIMKQAIDSVV